MSIFAAGNKQAIVGKTGSPALAVDGDIGARGVASVPSPSAHFQALERHEIDAANEVFVRIVVGMIDAVAGP